MSGTQTSETAEVNSSVVVQEEEVIDINNYTLESLVNKDVSHLSEPEVDAINKCTMGQADNPKWAVIRKNRITSSNFYSVHTRMISANKNPSCDISALLGRIMGYKTANPNIRALKYGRETEPIARASFEKLYKKRHSDAKF